ncbi:hypothetical protein PLICRDRAFT_694502 [Plicaturopsis crispa FD-325 SS-3]|nr:hypothetical protein PLICRDRAFT_694502 [Plicaturopsis crispa FD-325 SS-3]
MASPASPATLQSPYRLIDTLPEELLAEVFVQWALQDEDALWMASLVCHQWRRVVLSCSAAWSAVHVRVPEDMHSKKKQEDEEWCVEEEDDGTRGQTRPLDLWVARAGTAKLCVFVHVRALASTVTTIYSTIARISPYFDRVQELIVNVDSPILADALLTVMWDAAPLLLHLTINCLDEFARKSRSAPNFGESKPLLPGLWAALQSAPRLLSLTCIGATPQKTEGEVSVRSLRSVTIDRASDMSARQFVDGLEACSSLESLIVSRCSFDRPNSFYMPTQIVDEETVVVFPFMTRLCLINTKYDPCSFMEAPRLRTLHINGAMAPTDMSRRRDLGHRMDVIMEAIKKFGEILTAFLERGNAIEDLRLESSQLVDDAFLRVLELAPRLSALQLGDSLADAKAFAGLARSRNLQRVGFEACPFLTDKMLVDFIRDKNASELSLPLTEVDVRACPLVTSSAMVKVYELGGSKLRTHFSPVGNP